MALKRLRRNIRTLKTKKETKNLIKIKDPRSGKTGTWAPPPKKKLHKKRKKWGENEKIWLNDKSWTSYGVLASNPALVWFYMTFYNWKKKDKIQLVLVESNTFCEFSMIFWFELSQWRRESD